MRRYPAYKDSGVTWLGDVPAHWEMDRLRWSVQMCKNGIWGSDPEGEDGIICVRVADFDRDRSLVSLENPTLRLLTPSEMEDRILQRGDLLLEKSGGGEKQPVGFVVLYDHEHEAVCSNFVARMPIADMQNSKYWNYLNRYLYSIRVNVRSIKQTTGIQNLDSYSYLCEQVLFPPLAEQTAIANYLDRKTAQIDAVIAKKERLIELLREERTAVISQAVTKGLNPDAPMKDSGFAWLGEVPSHWGIDRLRWSVIMCKNGIWGSEPEGEDGIICVRVADFIRDRSLVSLENPTLRLLTPSEKEDRILQSGDLLLEKSGGGEKQPVGFVVLYDHEHEAVCSNFIARMPVAPQQDSRYWNYLNRYFYFVRVNVRSIKQTTGIQNLDSYSYLCERVPYPPLDEQTAIASYLDQKTTEIDQTITRTEAQIELLREYRTALISAVVTGKIDVCEEVEE